MEIDYKKLMNGQYEPEWGTAKLSSKEQTHDFAYNVLNFSSPLYSPVIDNAFLNSAGGKPSWPEKKTFAVCLTHDVDDVTLHSAKQAIRSFRSRMYPEPAFTFLLKSIAKFSFELCRPVLQVNKLDPLHCYEKWLEVETNVGAKSTFFFWPGWSNITKRHFSDCTYELYDRILFEKQRCSVSEMITEIDRRGYEIGLHASWCSFDDLDELKRQKAVIEKILGHPIESVRQHYLHYDIRITPRLHEKAGFKYDSTLGFNDNIGFRFGTSYPWYLYDLENKKKLSIMEVPLIIQDTAMMNPQKGMRIDAETAFRYVVQLTEAVELVGGVMTLLWHPNAVIEPEKWHLYKRILAYLEEKNAWFATTKTVGDWFKSENNKTAVIG